MSQCIATTQHGHQCRREAALGLLLCPMHETLRVEAAAAAPPATVAAVPAPIIVPGDIQPPLIAVVFEAAALVQSGDLSDDDALGRWVADALRQEGGTHDDVEYLIEAGCLPEWVRGYFRALAA